ncbi:MAG TPA: hypothetical protein VGX91_09820 [Candidatus Cybelea sp.]|jgi:sugar lactone lactonase YvrE|nr:hypothetical protein [Candidatus Cybelea sp.]
MEGAKRFNAIAIAAALFSGGCGGTLPGPGPGAGQQVQTDTGTLMYMTDSTTEEVHVYTYPGGVLQQSLQDDFKSLGSECVDAKGDVFVTDQSGTDIVEYAHGGSLPISTLQDPDNYPFACAVDPTSGNLAVANAGYYGGSGGGDIVLYAHARGGIKETYTDKQINRMSFCAYDNRGNLFVDGEYGNSSGSPLFAELLHGTKTFVTLKLDHQFSTPGPMQWDGTYLDIADQRDTTIYRFAISGPKGTTKAAVRLQGAQWLDQFWIDGSRVGAAALINHGSGAIWPFPDGGHPIKKIKPVYFPLGAVVSK